MTTVPGIHLSSAAWSRAWLSILAVAAFALPGGARAQSIAGSGGPPANQAIPKGSAGITAIGIIPATPYGVSNCYPFGTNSAGFAGFIYRNAPAFAIVPGSKISFDLGSENDVDIRRDIYFAVANANPGPPVVEDQDLVSQGISALGWTQVVTEAQIPENPRGNLISGDYELTYTVEAPFNFPGGGLIVGFAGAPPATYVDGGCEQVLVVTSATDPSGMFYGRFFGRSHLDLGVLDGPPGGGTALELGGIVIREEITPLRASSWGTLKIRYH